MAHRKDLEHVIDASTITGTSLSTAGLAIDRDITLFDTADMYGIGPNEELLGRGVRDARDHLVIATAPSRSRGH
jgi:aryl-alcohol dehydrogenase-like predicted oxidoreductase